MTFRKNALPELRTPITVVDASVAVAWCFADEINAYADAVGRAISKMRAYAPLIWPVEMWNAFLVGERHRRCSSADTARWMAYLRSLPIIVEGSLVDGNGETVFALARTYNLSAYDATYLELALRKGLPLATLDKKLARAAQEARVEIYKP